MHEDSPPPFIVIRTPRAPDIDGYEYALAFAGMVHEIVHKASSRYYLKDRLDRVATSLVFELGRAARTPPPLRWRNYRTAEQLLQDAEIVLDLFVHQKAAPELELERARVALHQLLGYVALHSKG